MYDVPIIRTVGDSAISVEFGNTLSEISNQNVRALHQMLLSRSTKGIVEMTPSYGALLIEYNPFAIDSYHAFAAQILEMATHLAHDITYKTFLYEIPTLYNGPDLQSVAAHTQLSTEEVIAAHSSCFYRIYMLGFTPGFPYLGGMDDRLNTPRLNEPRTHIKAGSVGIAGNQTGIYPVDSPGGWQLIGKTPLKLFDINREPAIFLTAGHYLKFVPIDEKTYEQLANKIASGEMDYSKWIKEYTPHGGS